MLILTILLLLLVVWLIGIIKVNDFKVATRNIHGLKKILIIFPHPDDESLSVSGLCKNAQREGVETTLLVLSKGEAGEAYMVDRSNLANIRENELKQSAKVIGIKKLIQFEFKDGKINNQRNEVENVISKQIHEIKPDLVITYDLSGLYGHEDHIVVSEVVTNLITKKYRDTKLWYVSYPKKVLDMISLPTHMAKNENFLKKRMEPNLKIFTEFGFIYSYFSVLSHKSQYQSFRNEELKYIPLLIAYSTQLYEYFYEVSY